MARSLKKGPYIDEHLSLKISSMKAGDRTLVKTWARRATITPEMVGFNFGVHNGKDFIAVLVVEDMVGHKLGEFSPSTKFHKHGGKMQKELEEKAQVAAAPVPVSGTPAKGVAKPTAKK